jgi:hypothetical protein
MSASPEHLGIQVLRVDIYTYTYNIYIYIYILICVCVCVCVCVIEEVDEGKKKTCAAFSAA